VVALAASLLTAGSLLIYPTDTLYALGGRVLDAAAGGAVRRAKGREEGKPLPLVAADLGQARALCASWPEAADQLAARFWPGPLSLVVPAAPDRSRGRDRGQREHRGARARSSSSRARSAGRRAPSSRRPRTAPAAPRPSTARTPWKRWARRPPSPSTRAAGGRWPPRSWTSLRRLRASCAAAPSPGRRSRGFCARARADTLIPGGAAVPRAPSSRGDTHHQSPRPRLHETREGDPRRRLRRRPASVSEPSPRSRSSACSSRARAPVSSGP
jgi:hypothetical protein